MLFVQAVDKLYYADPLIEKFSWHIQFWEGYPEIVIKRFHNTSVEAGLRRANKFLGEIGKVVELTGSSKRSMSFQVELAGPIPKPTSFSAAVKRPRWDSEFIGWTMNFDIEDLLMVFMGVVDRMLARFLSIETDELTVARVKERILQQHPHFDLFREITEPEIKNIARRYPHGVEMMR